MKRLSKSTQRFLLWAGIIIAGIAGIEITLGALNRWFFSEGTVRVDGIEHLLTDPDEDIIVIGNSAAVCHFDAERMEKTLGMTCFNGGTLGSSLKFNMIVLKGLLHHHHPRLVILALNPWNFTGDTMGETSLQLPYYYGRAGEEFDREIDEEYPLRSKFLALNIARTDRNLFRRLLYKSGAVTYPYAKGYQPILGKGRHIIECKYDTVILPDNEARRDIQKIVAATRKHNVPLLITIIPNRLSGPEIDELVKEMYSYADGKSVFVRNDTKLSPVAGNPDLFFDHTHMIREGAEIYTDSICRFIPTILQ